MPPVVIDTTVPGVRIGMGNVLTHSGSAKSVLCLFAILANHLLTVFFSGTETWTYSSSNNICIVPLRIWQWIIRVHPTIETENLRPYLLTCFGQVARST